MNGKAITSTSIGWTRCWVNVISVMSNGRNLIPWGVDGLNALVPVQQAGITLSTDSLYDEQGVPVQAISREEFMYDAGGFYLPVLQQQLQQAGLQLLEVGMLKRDGNVYLHENPRFICVTTGQPEIEQLNLQLQQRGLVLC